MSITYGVMTPGESTHFSYDNMIEYTIQTCPLDNAYIFNPE